MVFERKESVLGEELIWKDSSGRLGEREERKDLVVGLAG